MQISRSSSEKPVKDVRTLCHQCANDMRNAGYKLYKLNKPKVRCDKCIRVGYTFEVK